MDIDKIVRDVLRQVEAAEVSSVHPAAQAAIDGAQCEVDMARHLEHAAMLPDVSVEKIEELCRLARRLCIASVCVYPYFASAAYGVLQGSNVAVCVGIGIPNASMSAAAKVAEIREAIKNGASEVDVALNVHAVKSGRMDDVRRELDDIVSAAGGRVLLKVSYEQGIYTDSEKEQVLKAIRHSGADFVKIQNVVSKKAAAPEDIKFVRSIVRGNAKIKIDGGVKTYAHAKRLVDAGAERIGLSATEKVLEEASSCNI